VTTSISAENTIREILNSLNPEDRKRLMYSFEESLSAFVEYQEGYFMGVNVVPSDTMIIIKQEGQWSKGTVSH
jgi:hypothetical protein